MSFESLLRQLRTPKLHGQFRLHEIREKRGEQGAAPARTSVLFCGKDSGKLHLGHWGRQEGARVLCKGRY